MVISLGHSASHSLSFLQLPKPALSISLTIRTARVDVTESEIRDDAEARPGSFVRLTVEDTGEGMSEETLATVFEPFFTTKELGSGLGLAVVYGIVKKHDGWIRATSVPGEGSRFDILLPVAAGDLEDEDANAEPLSELRGEGQRVLLVEDEDSVRDLAQTILTSYGYEVVEARSCEEALERFHEAADSFDLLFSDVVLPDRDGLSLAEEIAGHRPDLPIVLTSGYTDDQSRWPLIREKAYPFLEKPYSVDGLLGVIKRAVTRG